MNILHKEKTTLIMMTAIPVDNFASMYDVRTPSVCLALRLTIAGPYFHINDHISTVCFIDRSRLSLYSYPFVKTTPDKVRLGYLLVQAGAGCTPGLKARPLEYFLFCDLQEINPSHDCHLHNGITSDS